MNCVILAGGRPSPEDTLYPYTQGQPKALLRLNGSTILEIVARALQRSQNVADVVVIGLEPPPEATFIREVIFLPSAGGIIDNGLSALNWLVKNRPENGPILFCSVDIPTITPEIVDEFIESCQPFKSGVYYSVVRREVMEHRFPGANRTYFHLKGLELAGGDMIIANVTSIYDLYNLLSRFENARKSPWKVALMIGPRKFFKFLIRQLSLDEVESAASKILGIKASVVVFPHAEVAMDIDEAQHLELIKALSGSPNHLS
jgi:molybdopterin-guanine dinucleotide biosynthesis protein A